MYARTVPNADERIELPFTNSGKNWSRIVHQSYLTFVFDKLFSTGTSFLYGRKHFKKGAFRNDGVTTAVRFNFQVYLKHARQIQNDR